MASLHTAALAVLACTLASLPAHADFTISKKPTHDVSCSAGVCTATAKGANLNVSELTGMLASGDATVKTGAGASTIQVLDGFSWTSTSQLTLDANKSVGFHKPVVVAGKGALTIIYNDGGADGDLLFFEKGKVDFWDLQSVLKINGSDYVLVGDLPTLASGANANPDGAQVLASYSIGNVSGKKKFTGGFIGSSIEELSIANSYWDIDTSGTNFAEGKRKQINGVTGLTDAQLKSGLPDGFDPAIWGSDPSINNGYPYLLANPPR